MQELNKEMIRMNGDMQELTSTEIQEVNGAYLDKVWEAGVAVGAWLASLF